MTGFGRGTAADDGYVIQAELRSLNNRFLEVRVRGLSDQPLLIARCDELLRGRFERGTLELSIRWEQDGEAAPRRLNRAAAERYHRELSEVGHALGIAEGPRLSDLVALGVFQEIKPDVEALWPVVERATEDAVARVAESRAKEGAALAGILAGAVEELRPLIQQALDEAEAQKAACAARLRERMAQLDAAGELERLESEIVLWAERSDVREELDRLRSHADRVEALLAASSAVGRELEFLAQEIAREAGTVAAKARSPGLARVAMDMRLVGERIREQARNVE